MQIPDRHKKAFESLVSMSDADVERLFTAFRSAAPSLDVDELAERVAENVDGLSPAVVMGIVRALVPLYLLRDRRGDSASSIVEDIAVRVWEDKDVNKQDITIEDFENRLTRFLNLEQSLGITSKAQSVLLENERLFCDSRVMTDIRPVFKNDPDETPEAAVIVHMLRITYHEDREKRHNDFFVALDTEDVTNLIGVLQRAERKAKSAATMIKASDLLYLGIPER